MVLVITGTLNRRLYSVEEESLLQVPRQRAHAKAGFIPVANLSISLNCSNGIIESWLFQRPDCGTNNFCSSGETLFAVDWNFSIGRFGSCDCVSRFVEDPPVNAAGFL